MATISCYLQKSRGNIGYLKISSISDLIFCHRRATDVGGVKTILWHCVPTTVLNEVTLGETSGKKIPMRHGEPQCGLGKKSLVRCGLFNRPSFSPP